jgi:tetratricopeptide (TPR) repeat protein
VLAGVAVLALWGALGPGAPAQATKHQEQLLAAKKAAYDANFQNDQQGLRAALRELDVLETDDKLGALALYYAGWTWWSLAGSQIQAGQKDDALVSLDHSVDDLRKLVALAPDNAEFQCQLTWSLISLAVTDGSKFQELRTEISQARKRALELAPTNPRVVMMDAGMIFNTPPQFGGSQEKGIARWLEAIRLFEAEKMDDKLQPDWGRVLAYGWLSNLYLQMTPPRTAEAKEMANRALALRPDFWYVKTQILPRFS